MQLFHMMIKYWLWLAILNWCLEMSYFNLMSFTNIIGFVFLICSFHYLSAKPKTASDMYLYLNSLPHLNESQCYEVNLQMLWHIYEESWAKAGLIRSASKREELEMKTIPSGPSNFLSLKPCALSHVNKLISPCIQTFYGSVKWPWLYSTLKGTIQLP